MGYVKMGAQRRSRRIPVHRSAHPGALCAGWSNACAGRSPASARLSGEPCGWSVLSGRGSEAPLGGQQVTGDRGFLDAHEIGGFLDAERKLPVQDEHICL